MKKKLPFLLGFIAYSELLMSATCSFLPSSRSCTQLTTEKQSNIYTQLSFLYWECAERNLDFAIKNSSSQANSQLSVHQPSLKWDPALRIMLGGHLPHDHWNFDFTYSFFFQHTDDRVKHNFDIASPSAFGSGILSVWTSPGAFLQENIYARWQSAQAKWKIHSHFFDWMLRHDLCNGYALSFQPACGIKMALLTQRFILRYLPGNIVYPSGNPETLLSSTINMNNRSLNIGPNFGCSTEWSLSRHFKLFGSLSAALLASHFHVGRNEYDVSTMPNALIGSYRISHHFWTYRPESSLNFGFRWKGCECSPTNAFGYAISASYEAQYWWKQNMLLRHFDAPNAQSQTLTPAQGDLFFQGLTIDLLFDF